jgi:hypothetical protein
VETSEKLFFDMVCLDLIGPECRFVRKYVDRLILYISQYSLYASAISASQRDKSNRCRQLFSGAYQVYSFKSGKGKNSKESGKIISGAVIMPYLTRKRSQVNKLISIFQG